MILLDWTRMGKTYCLAGVVAHPGQYQVVRPLLAKHREAAVRKVGWSPWLLDGHARWEVFELIGPQPAGNEAPHLEDLWVRELRSRRQRATPQQCQAILTATVPRPGEPLFGVPLVGTRTAAYLPPGMGHRSLVTLVVPAHRLTFSLAWRQGTAEPDCRVTLPLPELGERTLPVKDHFLLLRAEQGTQDLEGRRQALHAAVREMGDQVAVRLGLSRPFPANPEHGAACCWLMADGFFSVSHPQA